MSGLETLPPDQRAVLQLILVQGRGYADLAAMLKLDPAAVRERALAGAGSLVDAVPPARGALDAQTRARIVDYLLGQQDDGERIVTFAELGESAAACRWAQALREQLARVAQGELPEVPASAVASNGSGAPSTPVAAALSPVAAAPPVAAPPATPPPAPPSDPAAPSGPRPSRLGGAILIAGAAALAVVLAIVLIGGDDGASPSTSGVPAQTQASTSTQASTTPSGRQPSARIVAQVNLAATPAGGSAIAIGLVQQATNGRRALAVEAQRLPANGAQEIYAVWLQGAAGAKFLGFVPRQVRANGTFTVSAPLPANASSYATVLVTSEGVTAVPTTPGTAILSGPLRLTS